MIDFLLGVPGKLKTISDWLTTYWTAARAAKLDLLTVAPAPASTALTKATWTDVRAGKLDAVIQTSVIQSIQTGVTTSGLIQTSGDDGRYVDISITAVAAMSKCIVLLQGTLNVSGYDNVNCSVTARLISTTVLRIASNRQPDWAHGYDERVRWTVVEFK